ncbi:DUF1609 domain-containing protein [Encephalitozoon intestinalis]|nr:DUF1609 domain-containing protein [Encephalitozoon intestinalis]UTX46343.1 DUF1609 domain-containing protein [Encephalitozoon intestinalis]
MIWIYVVELLGLANMVYSSDEEIIAITERRMGRKMNDWERQIMVEEFENSFYIWNYRKMVLHPLVVHDDSFIVFPTTKYSEIEEGKREYVKEVVDEFPRLALWCMGFLNVPIYKNLIGSFVNRIAGSKSKDFHLLYECYKKDEMTFGVLTKKILKECKKALDDLGKLFKSEALEEIEKLNSKKVPAEKEKKELEKIKKHGELIRTMVEQNRILKALNIVCDGCLSLWEREEYRESFILKMRLKKLYTLKLGIEDKDPLLKYKNDIFSSVGHLNHDLLIDTDKKHGGEIAAELVKEAFLEYKDDYENEINRIVLEDEERKKREEEEKKRKEKEANQNAEELIREEEEEKRRRNQKGKSKSGGKKEVKKKTVTKDKKEELMREEEPEKGAVGGKKKEKTKKKNYKIHGRVFQWKKEPKVIKNGLDKGTEKKWRGRSIEEIREQKKFHDIVEVVGLLKDEDPDDFFSLVRSYKERGVKRERKVALAMLETKDSEKEIGIVEVGIFKDGGNDVVYHLMFKHAKEEKIGEVVNSVFVREEDGMDEIDKKNTVDIEKMENEERNEEASKFRFPRNQRCDIVKSEDEFKIVWKNPKDNSQEEKSLTIFRKPKA